MPSGPGTEERNPRTSELDRWSSREIVDALLHEDAIAVHAALSNAAAIAEAIERAAERIAQGGSIHYFGAGASGRLAFVDATEAVPTFGVPPRLFTAHFPGGAAALMDSQIDFEDADDLGYTDAACLQANDVAVGITASGTTAYVRGALRRARELGTLTILLTCNPGSPLEDLADLRVVAETGPEVLTGSTRLKAGTATKAIVNAFSTGVMVRSGHVYSNLMVGLIATNEKLRRRAVSILAMASSLPREACEAALNECGGELRTALVRVLTEQSPARCRAALAEREHVREVVELLGRHR